MGVIAFNPMLRAGYDVKLAAGVITAGGTLGILIPAVGDDHRLCRGRRAVRGEALCRRDVPGLFPVVPLPHLCRRLGADRPENRAAAAGGADPRKGAGLDHGVRAHLFAQHVRRHAEGAGLAGAGQGPGDRRQADDLWGHRAEFHHRAGAVPAHLPDAGDRVVVRRHPPAGRRRIRPHRRPAATGQRGAAAGRDAGRKGPGLPVLSVVLDQCRRAGAMDRTLLLAHERRAF